MSSRKILMLYLCISVLVTINFQVFSSAKRVGEIDIDAYREKVRRMFYHAYEGYLTHAYPYDDYSLTLIDAMDTLAVMGNYSEFRRIAHILFDKGESFFDIDINVSVFETNIRIVGGLLSAHLMMKRAGMEVEPGWPCSGPLLRMADNIARKILPAFDTPTGMPYGTVNLRHGVPKGETTVTCTAGIGTFIIEFGTLSRLTGDPVFEKTAIRAIRSLWKYRSPLGLLGNHIDVGTGKWTAQDSGIGGGIDSYFEYLVKGAIMFNHSRTPAYSVKKYLKRDDWYMWAQMTKGTITLPLFTSLDGYWPSVKGMLGDLDEAMKTMHNFHQVWRQFGFTPEYYNIPKAEVHGGREAYPLRPEIIESAMYLYRATKDPYLLEIGVDIVEAVEHSARTSCGYATVKDVRDHMLEDRMESFFLAETTKYLYLLFDPDNFIHNNGSHGDVVTTQGSTCVIEAGGYIFNTEAHPIDLAAVHCCSAVKKEDDKLLQEFHDNLDLLSLLDIVDESDYDWIESEKKKKKKKKTEEDIKGEKIINVLDRQSGEEDSTAVCQEKSTVQNDEPQISDDVTEVGTKADKSTGTRASEEPEHDQTKRKHHLHVVDIASFTEAERNLTRIFMEELKMDSIMKNISAVIAEKLKHQYKETEYERLAIDTARKILEAGSEVNVENTTDASGGEASDVTKENAEKDSDKNVKEAHETERQDHVSNPTDDHIVRTAMKTEPVEAENKDTVPEDSSKNTEKTTNLMEPGIKITVKRSDGSEEVVSELQQTSSDQNKQQMIILSVGNVKQEDSVAQSVGPPSTEPTAVASVDLNSEMVNPTLERFKSHIQSQIQHVEDQKQQQLQQSSTSSSSLVTEASLETKRDNLLSLTSKILKLFSSKVTGESKEGDEAESRTPNIEDLYASLASYPLNYFHDPAAMHCHAQPFHSRISVYGEMFPDE
ncbi:unnamed protein product [Candidula unifasciata]|uniref:alpha-1,2-Mannosidase n=1 Tax=Candidula unifasciata TaxID=100452 RepID=A0A8S4A541_9EUPU|nr:unnamed protein product [Candidula unifasciata]